MRLVASTGPLSEAVHFPDCFLMFELMRLVVCYCKSNIISIKLTAVVELIHAHGLPTDLMVKRNSLYLNSQELDQMDILTTDLETPEGQLKVEVCRCFRFSISED